jgi:hypothetical protein
MCTTGSAPNSTDREVQVELMDMTNTTEQFIIRGSDSSRHISFSYKVKFSDFYSICSMSQLKIICKFYSV